MDIFKIKISKISQKWLKKTLNRISNRLMQILKFSLHGAKTILIWVLMILPKFELIWLESDTAQTLQSLYGNYYGETNFFVHCSLAFPHIALVKSSLAILMGNFLSYNFANCLLYTSEA